MKPENSAQKRKRKKVNGGYDKMKKKFKLFLTGGQEKTVQAETPTQAKHKYYGSADHFKTERSIIKVRRKK